MKTEREVMRFITEEIANGEMTAVFKNRIARLLNCDEFHPSVTDRSQKRERIDLFFEASEGRIAEAYNKLTPAGKHGLGREFKKNLDRIRYFYNGGYDKHEVPKEKEEIMAKEVVEVKPEEVKLIPLEDLKRVVDFMQLCDIEAINVMEILKFLDCVRARQKPVKLADNPPDGLQA